MLFISGLYSDTSDSAIGRDENPVNECQTWDVLGKRFITLSNIRITIKRLLLPVRHFRFGYKRIIQYVHVF